MMNMPSERGHTTFGSARVAPKGRPKLIGCWRLREQSGNEPTDEFMEDEEKILAGRPDANMPALLTKDVHGG